MIFSRLSLPSQVCFALTCKPLFAMFGAVVKNDELRFPHVEFDGHGRAIFDPTSRARWQLLIRLERRVQRRDGRYCCGKCLKLHPPREFPWGLDYAPDERSCRYPGIVVLCSEVHLNARGKVRLIEALETGRVENASNWHKCRFEYKYSTGTRFDITTTISLSTTELSELLVDTQYKVRPGVLEIVHGPMSCPHIDIFTYLRCRLPSQVSAECCWCQTTIQVNRGDDDESLVQVTRNLGGKSYPASRTWENQCEDRYRRIHKSATWLLQD